MINDFKIMSNSIQGRKKNEIFPYTLHTHSYITEKTPTCRQTTSKYFVHDIQRKSLKNKRIEHFENGKIFLEKPAARYKIIRPKK